MRGRVRSPGFPAAVAIAGLLFLLGVVAVAASGRSPGGGETRPTDHANSLVADYLATLGLLLVPAGLILFVFAAFVRRSYMVEQRKKVGGGSTRIIASAAFLVVVLLAVGQGLRVGWIRGDESSKQPPGAKVADSQSKLQKRQPEYHPHFRWVPLVVVGGLIVGIGGTMAFLALRRKREELAARPVQLSVAEVLGETLDDLRAERDPRKAVIGAYAKMERALAARGLPRRESEAPLEYLARILDAVRASQHSVRRLTTLFERARFSPHEIDERMKNDAIDALTGLRAELEVAH
jgi:uncharacterized membrane protein YedE/YeeE